MFDEVQKAIRRLGGTRQVSVQLPLDDDGYFDRECPHPNCRSVFKVLFADWTAKVGDEASCPVCGHRCDSSEWNTPEQAKSIERQALAHLQKEFNSAIGSAVRRTRPTVCGGLVRMALSYRPAATVAVIPIAAAEAMQSKYVCEQCGCRYASVGIVFFCPACGHDSTATRVADMIADVRKRILCLPSLRAHLVQTEGKDAAENIERSIRENAVKELVGMFQHFADTLFRTLPNADGVKLQKNVFQRLDDADRLWNQATGTGFAGILSAEDVQRLKACFQKRHLLEHRNGMVDHDYVAKSGDHSFAVGQRLVIAEHCVLDMCDILGRLCRGMRDSARQRMAHGT